jgi:mRNA interferase MazF
MKQGDIWYANLNSAKGSEQAGFRPVLIISGNLLNAHLPVVVVVPLTTKIKKYKGNPVLKPSSVNGLKVESEALMFHIRSVSKDRLIEKIGTAKPEEISLAIKTVNDILNY